MDEIDDERPLFGRDVDDIISDFIKVGGASNKSALEIEVRRHLPEIISPLMHEDLTPEVATHILRELNARMGLGELLPYQWVMFAEPGPQGSAFLGVYITRAWSFEAAVFRASMLGISPGGRADGAALPMGMAMDANYCDRILNFREAAAVRDALDAMIN